jgi:hypothetical protein
LVFTRSLVLHERTIRFSLTNTGNFRVNMLIISFPRVTRLINLN